MSFFARRLRRERRVFLFSLAYYAGAGGSQNFVTTRVRRGGRGGGMIVFRSPFSVFRSPF